MDFVAIRYWLALDTGMLSGAIDLRYCLRLLFIFLQIIPRNAVCVGGYRVFNELCKKLKSIIYLMEYLIKYNPVTLHRVENIRQFYGTNYVVVTIRDRTKIKQSRGSSLVMVISK